MDYSRHIGLYCLYGNGDLVYTGEAGLGNKSTILRRLRQHRRDTLAGRWDRFSWFGRERAEGNAEVIATFAQMEAIMIAVTNPGFNKQAGAFVKAVQVFQVPHEEAEGDLDTKLDRLTDMLDELAKKVERLLDHPQN